MQFSLFGAAVAPPVVEDLDGILLAGGHWVRASDAARLSVVVADRWRAEALQTEAALRGVAERTAPILAAGGGWALRTAFRPDLVPLAARWTRGANQMVPEGLRLEPGGLRLWTIAGGRRVEGGYLLGTPSDDDSLHLVAGAALARHGLAATSVSHRRAEHGWRVTSAKRLRRLVELIGAPPPDGDRDWPVL